MMFSLLLDILVLLVLPTLVDACGVLTHAEIAYRTFTRFTCPKTGNKYQTMIGERMEYLLSGAFFPDWAYPIGMEDESEYAHWVRFYKHSFEYLMSTYSKPWSQQAKNLIVFLFGAISHAVADVDWHGLHYKQSIMHAIGIKNFMPTWTFPEVHSLADIFGEFQLGRVSTTDYTSWPSWQTPFEDLERIYKMAGYDRVDRMQLTKGMSLGFLELRAVPTFSDTFFQSYGEKCPVFVEHYEDYPCGGINQLTTQVMVCWQAFERSLETGELQWCPYLSQFMGKYEEQDVKRGLTLLNLTDNNEFQHPHMNLWTESSRVSISSNNSITSMGSLFGVLWKKAVALVSSASEKMSHSSDHSSIMEELWSPELIPYAGFGTSLAFHTDWNEERTLFAGIPRYGKESFQSGAVAIIDQDYNVELIEGEDFGGQFGSSIAIVGNVLAVSAPFTACKKEPVYTCGRVHLFDSTSKTPFATLILEGDTYPSFFGQKLSSGKLANDNVLVIGSPHMHDQLNQAGVVHVLSEKRLRHLRGEVDINLAFSISLTLPTAFRNNEGFDWFGWSSKTFDYEEKSYLAIGVPGHSESNSAKDVGAVIVYEYDENSQSLDLYRVILGTEPLGQFGKSIENYGDFLAIGSPSEKVDKQWQTGCVRLFDIRDAKMMPYVSDASSIKICGADSADHFGWSLSSDDNDNLIVGARSAQGEAGIVYTVKDQKIREIKGSLPKARFGESMLTIPWNGCQSTLVIASPSASKSDSPRTGMIRFYCHHSIQ